MLRNDMKLEVKQWPESQEVMDKPEWFFISGISDRTGGNGEYDPIGDSAYARILDESEYILVEKTTADEYNEKEYVRISDINKEIARNWKKKEK